MDSKYNGKNTIESFGDNWWTIQGSVDNNIRGWMHFLGDNPRGSRCLNILKGASEALTPGDDSWHFTVQCHCVYAPIGLVRNIKHVGCMKPVYQFQKEVEPLWN